MGNKQNSKKHANSIGYKQIPHANRVLYKILVFEYSKKLGLCTCYRCGETLELGDFTIDHIRNWRNQSNAKELFFDPDNIRFSHHGCNSKAALRSIIEHGTQRMYNQGKCRCDKCKEAHKIFMRKRREIGKG